MLALALGVGTAAALPVPRPSHAPPTAAASASPAPSALASTLPFDSRLAFVLDGTISSKGSQKGEVIQAHLKAPLVLNGRIIAPAGTPASIEILDASKADIADQYGFVDIFFLPLTLPNGGRLPLRAPAERLSMNVSAGHDSTVGIEDTIGDIFIPDFSLYQIFRHGKNFVLGPGATIYARTDAALTALPNGSVAVATPQPVERDLENPSSSFPVEPVATPFGSTEAGMGRYRHRQAPPQSPSPVPSTSPSPSSSTSPSPSPPSSPSPGPSPSTSPEASPSPSPAVSPS